MERSFYSRLSVSKNSGSARFGVPSRQAHERVAERRVVGGAVEQRRAEIVKNARGPEMGRANRTAGERPPRSPSLDRRIRYPRLELSRTRSLATAPYRSLQPCLRQLRRHHRRRLRRGISSSTSLGRSVRSHARMGTQRLNSMTAGIIVTIPRHMDPRVLVSLSPVSVSSK